MKFRKGRPMKKIVLLAVLIFATSAFAWKKEVHFITLPIIEGAGLYTSIRCLMDTRSAATQVPSITTIGLLAATATIGGFRFSAPRKITRAAHHPRVYGHGTHRSWHMDEHCRGQ